MLNCAQRRATAYGAAARMRGFSLLEVLIAMVVLAIGMLGLASLQSASLRDSQYNAQLTTANLFAQDLFERMRANADAAENGNYRVNFGQDKSDFTGSSVAQNDLNSWLDELEEKFPNFTASNCGTGNSSSCGAKVRVDGTDKITLTIRWNNERRSGDSASSFKTETQL